jgi:hypothetical protein
LVGVIAKASHSGARDIAIDGKEQVIMCNKEA